MLKIIFLFFYSKILFIFASINDGALFHRRNINKLNYTIMKFIAFCKSWEIGNRGKSSRFEADSFEDLRNILVREFALLPCPTRFLVCNELYENAYSGVIIDGTFYFTLFNYKSL